MKNLYLFNFKSTPQLVLKIHLFITGLFFLGTITGHAQTNAEYASAQTNSGEVSYQSTILGGTTTEQTVDNPSFAVGNDLTNRATLYASSGFELAGVGLSGNYSSFIDLSFANSTIPAGTTSYVKIATTDEAILQTLVGGTLGDVVGGLLGVTLSDGQTIGVEITDSVSNTVLSASSSDNFATTDGTVSVTQDATGDYYLMITPNSDYSNIIVTNSIPTGLLSLPTEVELEVYGAYYYTGATDNCGGPDYTSYDGSGISTALLSSNEGVINAEFALDANPDNFSSIRIGVAGIGASIEQKFYFDTTTEATDQFDVQIGLSPGFLELALLGNSISFSTWSNGTQIASYPLNDDIVYLDLLTLLGDNALITATLIPGEPIDEIRVTYTSLVTVSLFQEMGIDVYGIDRISSNSNITIDPISSDDIVDSTEATDPISISGSVTGDFQAGNDVSIIVDDTIYNGELVLGPSGSLRYQIDVPGASLQNDADKVVEVQVTSINTNCTETSSNIRPYTFILQVPTVNSQTTNDATPVLSGTAEAGSTLTVTVSGATYTIVAGGSGNWSLDTKTEVPDSGIFSPDVNGSNEVVVSSEDDAGNVSFDTTTNELVIDTTLPIVPIITSISEDTDIANDGITSDNTLIINVRPNRIM